MSKIDDEILKPRYMDISTGSSIICYIFKKLSHTASLCELNSKRVSHFTRCGKMGHDEIICWTNTSSATHRVYFEIVQSMKGDKNANSLDDKTSKYFRIVMETARCEVVATPNSSANVEPITKRLCTKDGMERVSSLMNQYETVQAP